MSDKDYGAELPEGFKIDAAHAPAASAPKDHGPELPAGFKLDAHPSPQSQRPSSSVKQNPPVPPQPSTGEFMWDKLKKGFSNLAAVVPMAMEFSAQGVQHTNPAAPGPVGMASGMAHLGQAGANYIRHALGMQTIDFDHAEPTHLAEQAQEGWHKILGVKNVPEPLNATGGKSKANEYLGSLAEFTGGALVPDAQLALTSERKLATFLVSTAGTGLASTSAVELKEIGGNIAHHFGLSREKGEQVGEFLGGLAGPGMVGMAAKAGMAGREAAKAGMAKAGVTGLGKDAQEAAANALVRDEITSGIKGSPTGQANMDRAAELGKEIPGFKPVVAQASDSPALVAMHKHVASSSPDALNKAAAADARNAKAIEDFKNEKFPGEKKQVVEPGQEAEGDPKLNRPFVKDPVLDPARAQLSATKAVNDLDQQKVASDLQKLSDQHKRTVDNQAIGEKLRDKYWQARSTAKIQQDANLADVYATAKRQGAKADMSDVRGMVKGLVDADKNTFQNMPPLFAKILKEYPEAQAAKVERQAVTPNGAKKPVYRTTTTPATPARNEASFEELHSLYKQANKDWADATAAGDAAKAHYMQRVKDLLKEKVGQFEGPEHGELAQKFSKFNEDYRKYAQTFKEGAGAEIARRGKNGLSRDAEDIVAKTVLKAGDKKKGVQDFFKMFGDDHEAANLLHDGIMDNFSKRVMSTGQFNPKAARAFIAQHEQALNELPSLKARLEDSRSIGQTLLDRQAVLQKQARKLDQTYLAKVAGSSNADALISRALTNTTDGPKVMKALLVGAKSTESKQAIARAIVDSVTSKGHGLDFIMEHQSTLKPVLDQLGPDHWKNLKTIAEAEEIAGRVKAPTSVELKKLEDVGTKYTGTSVKSLFATAKAANSGRLSKGYAILDAAGRFVYKIKGEKVQQLREAALFDPDLAGLMAQMAKSKGEPTHGELLNLQRLSFNAGVVSSIEAVGHKAERNRKHED